MLPSAISGILSAIAFSIMNVVVSAKKDSVTAFEFNFFRGLVCCLGTLPFVLSSFGPKRMKFDRALLLRGFFGQFAIMLYFVSLQRLSPELSRGIYSFHPIFLTLILFLKFKRKPSLREVFLIGLSQFCVLMLAGTTNVDPMGVICATLGSILAAFSYIYIKKSLQTNREYSVVFFLGCIQLLATPIISKLLNDTNNANTALSFSMTKLKWGITVGAFALIGQFFLTLSHRNSNVVYASSLVLLQIPITSLFFGLINHTAPPPGKILLLMLLCFSLYQLQRLHAKTPSVF